MTEDPPDHGFGLPPWIADPRTALLAAALLIEATILVLWPTLYYGNAPDQASGIQGMFFQRYVFVAPLVYGMRAVVDVLFPDALSTWENLVPFLVSCFIFLFVIYALVAARITPRKGPRGAEPTADATRLAGIRLRWILAPLLLFQVSLICIPSTMTTDVYNYALYGEMPALYDQNPFVHTPQEFPQSPLFYLIPIFWHDAPSVYGPLWVDVSVAVASIMRPHALADELLTYRAIANVSHFANTWLVWLIARRIRRSSAASAAIAYGWNPLMLVDFSFNGHNDVAMLTLTLLSLWMACARLQLASSFVMGLSVATKYTSILIAPLLLLWGARSSAPLTRDALDAGIDTAAGAGSPGP